MTTNPRYVTRALKVGRKEFPLPATHCRLPNFNPEQKLRSALEGCDDFEVVIHVCRYLREALADYGDQGKVATKLVDIIEEVVS